MGQQITPRVRFDRMTEDWTAALFVCVWTRSIERVLFGATAGGQARQAGACMASVGEELMFLQRTFSELDCETPSHANGSTANYHR